MTYYRRGSNDLLEELAALGVGVAAGAAAAYLTRLWIRREPVERAEGSREENRTSGEDRHAP